VLNESTRIVEALEALAASATRYGMIVSTAQQDGTADVAAPLADRVIVPAWPCAPV